MLGLLRLRRGFSSSITLRPPTLGFSSSITLGPPTPGHSKHHLHLAQRASPNVINCINFFSTDASKKVDLKLRKVVQEALKSCAVQKPQVPKDFPFEVEDIPKRPCLRLKLNRPDAGEKFNVLAFLPEDVNTIATDGEHSDEPLTFIILKAYIVKENGERLIMQWVADPDPDLCFAYRISLDGVELEKEEVERFDWRGTLGARGIDDSILTQFSIDYLKFRSDRKRWLALKKFEEFIKYSKFNDIKVYATPWGETLAPHSKEWNPWIPYGCLSEILTWE